MFKICLETGIEIDFNEEEFRSIDLVNAIMSEIWKPNETEGTNVMKLPQI